MSGEARSVRHVLGFDGGCAGCTGLAGRIGGLLEGRLAVRNLREPELRAWRREALGEGAPWAPTLFEVGDGRVRAWTGWPMAWRLARLLGPARAWQVARAIGEAGLPPDAALDPGRRRLLRTLGGAALALAVVSGAKLRLPAAVAAAQGGPITAEPPDERTRADLLARARSDARARRLAGYLASAGFTPTGAPVVLAGRQDGKLLRTVVVTEYASRAGGQTAALGFGVEAGGETWSHAVVREGGKPRFGLRVSGDRVERVEANERQAQVASSLNCTICQALCGGLCVVGCGVACFLVCGINFVCLLACGFICGAACVGIGCQEACARYCAVR